MPRDALGVQEKEATLPSRPSKPALFDSGQVASRDFGYLFDGGLDCIPPAFGIFGFSGAEEDGLEASVDSKYRRASLLDPGVAS